MVETATIYFDLFIVNFESSGRRMYVCTGELPICRKDASLIVISSYRNSSQQNENTRKEYSRWYVDAFIMGRIPFFRSLSHEGSTACVQIVCTLEDMCSEESGLCMCISWDLVCCNCSLQSDSSSDSDSEEERRRSQRDSDQNRPRGRGGRWRIDRDSRRGILLGLVT